MNHRLRSTILIVIPSLLLIGATVALAQGSGPQADIGQSAPLNAAAPAYTYTTAITVTSGADLDTSKSTTCYSGPAASPCTLRRAIVEARTLAPSLLPVLIRFDIPTSAGNGYNPSLSVWEIETLSTTDPYVFRRLTGDIIIDGDTQPGGRTDGPKIIIVGPGTGQKDALIVGDFAGQDNIQIYGLGFQNFRTHVTVNTNNNIIEGNWFGLTSNGMNPYLRDDNPEDGSGSSGISFNGNPMNNLVRNNVFLGFDGVAVAIRGESNVFERNYVGTRANGTLNKQTDPSQLCKTVDWLGGGGVSVEGEFHEIKDNVFAGLRQEIFTTSTQPDAIRISGDNHKVHNNKIGLDATDAEVGVCGRGVYLAGANAPDNTEVLTNTIVNPELSAISINGPLVDANTLRTNVIKKATAWPQIEGNPEPEAAIQFGPTVPSALRDFNPAEVTSIEGTTVSGGSGTNSPCPNCIVELFLDDNDNIVEALQSLAVTTSDGSGNWTTTIPSELGTNQRIRTTSTTAQFGTITNMSAGTTTKLSGLYTAEVKIFLPLVVRRHSPTVGQAATP
jgi:hypothetical protein